MGRSVEWAGAGNASKVVLMAVDFRLYPFRAGLYKSHKAKVCKEEVCEVALRAIAVVGYDFSFQDAKQSW